MLAELLLHAITRAPAPLRAMGLVTESIGLWSRGSRRRREWEEHGRTCRAIVSKVIAGMPRRRTAVVLGSGLVRDVPIDDLASKFERVVLVDAVHLPIVRLRLARRRNVTFLIKDLSGVAELLAGRADQPVDPLAAIAADATLDLVVSANVLSQLPIGVETWLERNPGPASERFRDLPGEVVRRHLDGLSTLNCRVCLLTDVEMREEDRSGATMNRLDLLHGYGLPEPDQAWDWPVAPFGEVDRHVRYVHRVHAYGDWRTSLGG